MTLTYDSLRQRYIYDIHLINNGKGFADNVRIKENVLYSNNGVDFIQEFQGNGDFVDKYLTIAEGTLYDDLVFLRGDQDLSFVCIEVKYENYFNEEMLPYRNIYLFKVSDVNKNVSKVDRYEKDNVEKYLKYNKLWQN